MWETGILRNPYLGNLDFEKRNGIWELGILKTGIWENQDFEKLWVSNKTNGTCYLFLTNRVVVGIINIHGARLINKYSRGRLINKYPR